MNNKTRRIIEEWYLRLTDNRAEEGKLLGRDRLESCLKTIDRVDTEQGFVAFAEMPLIGTAFLDLTVCSMGRIPEADDEEQGYRDLLDYQRSKGLYRFGFGYDLSKNAEADPHIVISLKSGFSIDRDYLERTLSYFSCAHLTDPVWDFLTNLKENFELAYFGSYRCREDKPFRLTVKIKDTLKYYRDHELFIHELRQLGFMHFYDHMFETYDLFFKNNETLELCFDMKDDGSLSEMISLQYGTRELDLSRLTPYDFENSRNMFYYQELERRGVIDERYKAVIGAIYTNVDNSVIHAVHTLKIKYKKGTLMPPKVYTELISK